MSRGLPTSGTIKLTDVTGAFSYSAANVLRTDTYSTASANGSSTAPTGAVAVLIEVWGGGGGGRGYSILNDYGGGGGGYSSIISPCNNSTTLGYTVGAGGSGGAVGANGSFGGTSYAWSVPALHYNSMQGGGGTGGTTAGSGGGSSTLALYSGKIATATGATGSAGTTSVGGNSGGGEAGGGSGAAGTAPGGGGGPGVTSGVAGGNGAVGQVRFTWYGRASTNNLRGYLAGGSWVRSGAAGANQNIPASGTIKLTDFYSAEEIGFHANAALNFSNGGGAGTVWANCKITATGNVGGTGLGTMDYAFQTWMRRLIAIDSSSVTQHFDVLFNRTGASGYDTALYGSAANTWIQCSSEPSWNVRSFLSGYGSVSSTATGYLAFRRRSDNVVVANIAFSITSTAAEADPGDTK